jgi:hypothetical protein
VANLSSPWGFGTGCPYHTGSPASPLARLVNSSAAAANGETDRHIAAKRHRLHEKAGSLPAPRRALKQMGAQPVVKKAQWMPAWRSWSTVNRRNWSSQPKERSSA